MTPNPKKVLVILPGPMGDTILATPALRGLREALPEARITFLGNAISREVLSGNPWMDDFIEAVTAAGEKELVRLTAARLRAAGFDAAILLSNSWRSALIARGAGIKRIIGYKREGRGCLLTDAVEVFRLLDGPAPVSMVDYYLWLMRRAGLLLAGKELSGPQTSLPELFVSPVDADKLKEVLSRWQLTDRDRVAVLVPGGAYGGSKWWPVERFAGLADRLSQDGFGVVISCAPNESERALASQIQGQCRRKVFNFLEAGLGLAGVKALIQRSALVVSNDTGPVHIAAALGRPLVTLFGPTDPRWTATGYSGEIRLRQAVVCGPCQLPVCPRDHGCLREITVDQVYAAVGQLLEAPGGSLPTPVRSDHFEVFDESFAPLAEGCGLVHKDYVAGLQAAGLDSLEKIFACQQGQRLDKPGLGTRQRWRMALTVAGRPTAIYLKRYGSPSWSMVLKRLLGQRTTAPIAIFDFAAAMTLAKVGVAVPRPIAYGFERGGLRERRSFVMLEELPGAEALERLLPRWRENAGRYALLRDKKELIRHIADLVRRLHEAGYFHRDLYLAHLFISKNRQGGERLNVIDLQRVFRPRWRRRRWQVKDLAQLYYSARRYFSRVDMLRFAHYYWGNRPSRDMIRDIERKARWIERQVLRRKRRQES